MVEAAIVLPIVILITLALVSFSIKSLSEVKELSKRYSDEARDDLSSGVFPERVMRAERFLK